MLKKKYASTKEWWMYYGRSMQVTHELLRKMEAKLTIGTHEEERGLEEFVTNTIYAMAVRFRV